MCGVGVGVLLQFAALTDRRMRLGYENIIVDRNEGVGVVTLNRPEVLNALSRDLYREIDEVISEFEADDDVKSNRVHRRGRAGLLGRERTSMRSRGCARCLTRRRIAGSVSGTRGASLPAGNRRSERSTGCATAAPL